MPLPRIAIIGRIPRVLTRFLSSKDEVSLVLTLCAVWELVPCLLCFVFGCDEGTRLRSPEMQSTKNQAQNTLFHDSGRRFVQGEFWGGPRNRGFSPGPRMAKPIEPPAQAGGRNMGLRQQSLLSLRKPTCLRTRLNARHPVSPSPLLPVPPISQGRCIFSMNVTV